MASMHIVTVHFHIAPDHRADFLRAIKANASRSVEHEPGCRQFDVCVSPDDAGHVFLYEVYDEVTPFEVPGDEGPGGYHGPEQPESISVLIRRDYHVVDSKRLRAQAERLDESLTPGGGGTGGLNAAIGVLFGEYEPDEIAARSEEFGLEEGDSTLWVAAAEPSEPGEWLPEPFEHADPQLLICRFDVSEVYDDEDLDD